MFSFPISYCSCCYFKENLELWFLSQLSRDPGRLSPESWRLYPMWKTFLSSVLLFSSDITAYCYWGVETICSGTGNLACTLWWNLLWGQKIYFIRYSPLSEDKSENLRNIVQGWRLILSNKSQRTQSEDFYLTKLVWGLELYFLNLKILSEDKWAIYFIHHKSIELYFFKS